MACAICQQPIAGSFQEINGAVAAALGAVYFGIEALLGYEFGLVAVVVGLLVGQGSQSVERPGWLDSSGPQLTMFAVRA